MLGIRAGPSRVAWSPLLLKLRICTRQKRVCVPGHVGSSFKSVECSAVSRVRETTGCEPVGAAASGADSLGANSANAGPFHPVEFL